MFPFAFHLCGELLVSAHNAGSLVVACGGGCGGTQVDLVQKCVLVIVFSICGPQFHFDLSPIALVIVLSRRGLSIGS